MKRIGALALAALALAACATETGPRLGPGPAAPAPPPPPPPPAAATIIGHGAYRLRSGAHGDCTGLSVALMHDTPGFRRRILALYGSAESARLEIGTVKARSAKLGPSAENPLAASVQCEAGGAFSFRDVAGGSYFIIARVKVVTAQGALEDLVVMRHIDLIDGQTRDVSLAP
ncbi:MAG: hypothetical protein P4L73_13120 [Caulobacteraceae bacterium]|nr:hypothetical protein [Caulobacteraceae bacterium]